MKRFENKVVIVTGAGGGIGSDTAISFAAEGAKVAVVDFNGETANETVKKITDNGGQAKAYVCDVTDFHAVEKTARCRTSSRRRFSTELSKSIFTAVIISPVSARES